MDYTAVNNSIANSMSSVLGQMKTQNDAIANEKDPGKLSAKQFDLKMLTMRLDAMTSSRDEMASALKKIAQRIQA